VKLAPACGRTAIVACVGGAIGLAVVAVTYLWPFLQDGQIVFWHYAGSDGYMYMRIAEFVGDLGTAQNPSVGIYDGASGFVRDEMLRFHMGLFVDKPATIGVLAALAALLGLLPHEAFSPLTIAALILLYISLLVFGRSIRLHFITSALFAAFGALGTVAWLMGTYTFLGNVLALPFLPLLLPLGRPPSFRLAAYAGLLLAALTLVFPDGMLVVVGLLAPYVLVGCWQAIRKRTLKSLLGRTALDIAIWILPMFAFGGVLIATLVGRLDTVLARGVSGEAPSKAGFVLHSLQSFNWLWPAFNLNVLPPEPLRAEQLVPALLLVVACLAYIAGCVWSRRADVLFFGLLSMLLLLAIGAAGGIFRSDYELFRALTVLFFVPLAVVFSLPERLARMLSQGRIRFMVASLVVLAMLPIVARFAANDQYQFDLRYGQHLADAQYTSDDIRSRQKAQQLIGKQTIVMSSETPSFTAFANVLMLFAPLSPGVPNAFYKFVFFPDVGNLTPVTTELLPRNEQYTASFVLRNSRYGDILDPSQTHQPTYSSDDFALFENDLIPFFDNDTFPAVNPFPLAFLKPRGLAIARTLSQRTEIPFFSKLDRQVDVQVAFNGAKLPTSVTAQFDGASAETFRVDADGVLRISGLYSAAGLHKLVLGPLEPAAQVTSLRLLSQS
jgi:hypothetical protein